MSGQKMRYLAASTVAAVLLLSFAVGTPSVSKFRTQSNVAVKESAAAATAKRRSELSRFCADCTLRVKCSIKDSADSRSAKVHVQAKLSDGYLTELKGSQLIREAKASSRQVGSQAELSPLAGDCLVAAAASVKENALADNQQATIESLSGPIVFKAEVSRDDALTPVYSALPLLSFEEVESPSYSDGAPRLMSGGGGNFAAGGAPSTPVVRVNYAATAHPFGGVLDDDHKKDYCKNGEQQTFIWDPYEDFKHSVTVRCVCQKWFIIKQDVFERDNRLGDEYFHKSGMYAIWEEFYVKEYRQRPDEDEPTVKETTQCIPILTEEWGAHWRIYRDIDNQCGLTCAPAGAQPGQDPDDNDCELEPPTSSFPWKRYMSSEQKLTNEYSTVGCGTWVFPNVNITIWYEHPYVSETNVRETVWVKSTERCDSGPAMNIGTKRTFIERWQDRSINCQYSVYQPAPYVSCDEGFQYTEQCVETDHLADDGEG